MMKKLLLILSLLVLSTSVFAGVVQLGVDALYTTPITADTSIDSFNNLGIEDFRFGADARFNLGMLRIGVMALLEGAGSNALQEPGVIEIIPTIGFNFEIAIIQIGIGAGPSIIFNFGDANIPDPVNWGAHIVSTLNFNIGPVSPGLIVGTSINLNDAVDIQSQSLDIGRAMNFYAGLSVLINL